MDASEGWEAIAGDFLAARTDIGAALVAGWARANLSPGATILDIGCGSGAPVAQALVDAGFAVAGVDPSPTLIAAFRQRFPDAPAACEPAQTSPFFHRRFDAAVAIGLLFLLTPDDQQIVLRRMADALEPCGRLLFTAPRQPCAWADSLTGRPSRSLGQEAYAALLMTAGFRLLEGLRDEGANHYYHAIKPACPPLE